MSEELKPCPACGKPAKESAFAASYDGPIDGYRVECSDQLCGFGAPLHRSWEAARRAWNRRPLLSLPRVEEVRREALLAWMNFFADFWDGGSVEDCFDERELALKQLTLRALSPPVG